MKRVIILLALNLILAYSICYSQSDNTLAYMDLIIGLNTNNITESNNQYLINKEEIPQVFNDGCEIIEKIYMKDLSGDSQTDTVLIVNNVETKMKKVLESKTKVKKLADGIFEISSMQETNFGTETSSYKYVDSTLVQLIDNGTVSDFKFTDEGLLSQYTFDSKVFIGSEKLEPDTILYKINWDAVMPGSGHIMPDIKIKLFPTNSDSCYCYQNFVTKNELGEEPIMNMEKVQCKNGSVVKEVIWDDSKNYTEIKSDYDFNFNGDVLVSKQNLKSMDSSADSLTEYQYNDKGNLELKLGKNEASKYLYDKFQNVIERIDYNPEYNNVESYLKREIKY